MNIETWDALSISGSLDPTQEGRFTSPASSRIGDLAESKMDLQSGKPGFDFSWEKGDFGDWNII